MTFGKYTPLVEITPRAIHLLKILQIGRLHSPFDLIVNYQNVFRHDCYDGRPAFNAARGVIVWFVCPPSKPVELVQFDRLTKFKLD